MTTDILRVEANERVDLSDFLFAVDESMRSQSRHWADQFFRDDTRDGPSWILSGFDMTYLAAQLTVTKGKAILGHREEGVIHYGSLTTEGPVERVVDVSTFSNGTYNVYIRFELVEGESGSRAFWNPAGDGSEFAQTVSTRRLANWSVRVELTNPGDEWLKIGYATISGGVVTGVTHQRDLFFEGNEHLQYQSQWSSDGGGIATDRNSDRTTYGISDLHTFTAAMRQCLEDIKGRGLRRWWERDIGGLNVGFDDTPVEDNIAVGDEYFRMFFNGTDSYLYFDDGDFLWFDRSANLLTLQITGAGYNPRLTVDVNGTRVARLGVGTNLGVLPTANDQIAIGDADFLLSWDGSDSYLYWDFTTGDYMWLDRTDSSLYVVTQGSDRMRMGTSGTRLTGLAVQSTLSNLPVANQISIGNTAFLLSWNGIDPFLQWDANDYFWYDRDADGTGTLYLYINSNNVMQVDSGGTRFPGLSVSLGMGLDTAADSIRVGDAAFYLWFDGSDPWMVLHTNEYMRYRRSSNTWEFVTASTTRRHAWMEGKAYMLGVSGAPTSTLTVAGDYSYAQSTGMVLHHGLAQTGNMNGLEVKALSTVVFTSAGSGDQSVNPATTLELAKFYQKADASWSKAYRVTAWGQAYRDATVQNLGLRIRVTDDEITYYDAIYGLFDPGATFATEATQSQWRMEAMLYCPNRGAAVTVRMSGKIEVAGSALGVVTYHNVSSVVSGNMDLTGSELVILATATGSAAGVKTVDLKGMIIEEVGGHSNVP